jgi:hypothetical protein
MLCAQIDEPADIRRTVWRQARHLSFTSRDAYVRALHSSIGISKRTSENKNGMPTIWNAIRVLRHDMKTDSIAPESTAILYHGTQCYRQSIGQSHASQRGICQPSTHRLRCDAIVLARKCNPLDAVLASI